MKLCRKPEQDTVDRHVRQNSRRWRLPHKTTYMPKCPARTLCVLATVSCFLIPTQTSLFAFVHGVRDWQSSQDSICCFSFFNYLDYWSTHGLQWTARSNQKDWFQFTSLPFKDVFFSTNMKSKLPAVSQPLGLICLRLEWQYVPA